MTPAVRPGARSAIVVLDNEAAQALATPHHPKPHLALSFLGAVATRSAPARVYVPTVVRVEAGIDRRSPTTTAFNRLRIADVPLGSPAADQAARLHRVAGSVVDACVAVAAADLSGTEPSEVVVLTADLTDLPPLLAEAGVKARVHRL